MPSPTSTNVPTLRVSVVSSNWSIADLMMLTISSERMAMGSPIERRALVRRRSAADARSRQQLLPEPFEAAPNTCVDEAVADAHGQPADERGIDGRRDVH